MSAERYIGLISGTSMDALDCVLVTIRNDRIETQHHLSAPIPESISSNLKKLCANQGDLHTLGDTDAALAQLIASAVQTMLDAAGLRPGDIAAIGSHGQTIWHEPPQSTHNNAFTLQIGDPNTIAELTGITTVGDFRRRDMAAGGQGAPLVTALHRALFQSRETNRIVLNLGGIANITWLPAAGGKPSGLDTGPANVLMNEWTGRHLGKTYDDAGRWAASGEVDDGLLQRLLDEPYFLLPPPKSTGRELFNLDWLDRKLGSYGKALAPETVQATLLMLTVESASREIEKLAGSGEVLACGGGVYNTTLMNAFARRLPEFKVGTTTEHGLDAKYVEATAFAWFAYKTLRREPIDFSPFTGASKPVIAGGIYFAP